MAAPKLRFKEFEGDWEKKTLGEVVKFSNSRRIPLSESDRQKRQGTYRYYGASGVIDYIDDYIFDGQYILIGEDGANILTRSSTLAFVVEGKFWVNNHAHIFQSKKGDNNFLATYLESLNYEKYNSGTAQPKLNLENLKKVIVADPSKEEQTKIASFLSAVDEKISQLNQKHVLLNQYKQGMMQKLFSQQLRFKADDGCDFREWEDVNLGEIVKIKSGYSPSKYDLRDKGNIPFLKVEELNNCVKFQKDSRFYAEGFESDLILKNSIIFPKRGAAILNNKVRILSVDSLLDSNLMALIPSKSIFYEYLYYLITFIELFKIADTSSIPQINNKHIEPYSVDLPCLEEQTKIANFLSAIDQKIEVVTQQIEQTKVWKKGLLQQMFV